MVFVFCFFVFNKVASEESKVFLNFFGCAGSLLLSGLSSSCGEWMLLSRCDAQASHCGGISRFVAQALGSRGFSSGVT